MYSTALAVAGGTLGTGGVVPRPLYTASLGCGALLVLALLYAERPPVTRGTVLALVPWMVVAPALHVLATFGGYPPAVEFLFRAPLVYVTAFTVTGISWTSLTQLSRSRLHGGNLPHYLAAMGIGAMSVVVPLVIALGSATPLELALLLGIPVGAAALAGVAYLLLILWRADAAAYTGAVGGLAVYGHTLDAVTTLAAVRLLGETATLHLPAAIAALAGVSPTVAFADVGWLFVPARILVALGVVAAVAPYTRREPSRGYLVLAVVAALGLLPGVQTLFTMTIG